MVAAPFAGGGGWWVAGGFSPSWFRAWWLLLSLAGVAGGWLGGLAADGSAHGGCSFRWRGWLVGGWLAQSPLVPRLVAAPFAVGGGWSVAGRFSPSWFRAWWLLLSLAGVAGGWLVGLAPAGSAHGGCSFRWRGWLVGGA